MMSDLSPMERERVARAIGLAEALNEMVNRARSVGGELRLGGMADVSREIKPLLEGADK